MSRKLLDSTVRYRIKSMARVMPMVKCWVKLRVIFMVGSDVDVCPGLRLTSG